ncbi:sulfite exporter TauE/SafE family protein [Ovoidimarina sediminis]|uniref:sulfite exporter TauE/SafE family protein n=1 Tax=Ovoidimarina sediminis TaxID=3079856 RepID=UPI00290D6A5C|nr:sulfite exporter TauE/SafE family protein [Rhodophyticola sp. MJ-SS7]MDU8944025.1 sulfite exporter TauE/SafE family protein [Rhodophyticola sp. MJ-SS7]
MDDLGTLLLLSTGAFLIAGTVKGAVGIGLPTTAIGLMTLAIDPRTAIALILVPMIVSNAWQVYRSGEILTAARRYLPFAAALMAGVWVTVSLTANAPDRVLFGVLGVAILIFVAVNATRFAPRIPDAFDRPAQIGFGIVAGVMGGLTSVWAPPMAVYLAARRVPKDEFVRASGLLIFLGSLPLAFGYLREGFVTTPLLLLSLGLLVPTILGFTLGEALRTRLSEEAFRRVLLGVFFLMGLNLVRRAVF